MSSIIEKFFSGLKFLFGKEYRYYSISFIIITLVLTISSFNLFVIKPHAVMSITVMIGLSFAHSFFVLALLSFTHEKVRDFLLESKWRGLIAPLFAIFGTLIFFIFFNEIINRVFTIYITIIVIICVYAWLVFQAIGINFFSKFTSEWINESIPNYKWKISLSIIFCVIISILFFLSYPIISELKPLVMTVYPFYPVDSLFFINLGIFLTAIITTTISLFKKMFSVSLYISGFFLICFGYQFYLPIRIIIYAVSYFRGWIPTISIFDLLIVLGALIYTLQSFGGYISKGKKTIIGLFFIIFGVSWIYETWYISTLMMDAIHGGEVELTNLILSGISDFLIYVFSSILSIALGISFYIKFQKAYLEYVAT
ncbi:MAG: hypothetical protein ACTSXT_08855 [Candidatus Helarchaeota archaeon]